MKVITVTVVAYGNMALYNIESTESHAKDFDTYGAFMGFTKVRNFVGFDNKISAKNKIDMLIRTTENYIKNRKTGFDNIDELLNLFLQATVEGKILCRRCGNSIKPGDAKCNRCERPNELISNGFI